MEHQYDDALRPDRLSVQRDLRRSLVKFLLRLSHDRTVYLYAPGADIGMQLFSGGELRIGENFIKSLHDGLLPAYFPPLLNRLYYPKTSMEE